MEELKKKYFVMNYDIKADNKTKEKYTSLLKKKIEIDIRTKNNLLKVNMNSIKKIFNLIKQFPEENILFLYEDSKKNEEVTINNPVLDNSEIGTLYGNLKNKKEIELNPLINTINHCIPYCYFIAGILLFFHLCLYLFSPEVNFYFNF